MKSAPSLATGRRSAQTARTCLAAGSMVMTTSASPSRTAATAEGSIATPVPAAAAREASEMSKPTTGWPAFTRLAAIGPPMLPSPMKAMVLMTLPCCDVSSCER